MAFRGPNHGPESRPPRTPPPDDTHQEAAYLKMLGAEQRPVSIKLRDGCVVRGWIEYYDRMMVRLTREGEPNLFIFKHEIAYIAEEAGHATHPDDIPAARDGNSGSAR